jgi:nitrate reductase cytochrome c-type subunit
MTISFLDYYWTLANFAVRPDHAARDNGLSKDESRCAGLACENRASTEPVAATRLSANGFM